MKTKRINLDLDSETMRQITALKRRLRCSSVTETLRRAVATSLAVTAPENRGVKVIIP